MPIVVSIPYGKGKGENAREPHFERNVSIPYGKGKADFTQPVEVGIEYQFPMGKVEVLSKSEAIG